MKTHNNVSSRYSNNFDFIRLAAASFVLIGHAPKILNNEPLFWDPIYELVGMHIHTFGVIIFFIISGFLVTKSWESKMSILDFFTARVLRIFPALICVVLLSVFVLGLSLTKYSAEDYLSSQATTDYLKNITLYRMHYYLPGIFEANPGGASINGSLWTMPYEFTCYFFLFLLGVFAFLKYKWMSLFLLIGLVISYIFFNEKIDTIVIPVIGIDFKHFFILFLYFLSGIVYYLFRNLIKFGLFGFLLCIVLVLLIKLNYLSELLLVFILPYFILMFAQFEKIRLNKIGKYGDFSYGLYLYAFPVQQLLVYFFPVGMNLLIMILLSFLCTLPLAILSWKLIENPALNLRLRIYRSFQKLNLTRTE